MEKKKFAVIGGGWSGLYVLKYLLEEGLDVRLYEREPKLGGVWLYKETQGGVYRTTHVTSSKTYLHASDFPLSDETPHFPKHDEILTYLNLYADHFNLWSRMHFTHEVIKIERNQGQQWRLRFRHDGKETEDTFDGVVITTGQHQTANDLRDVEPFNQFTGTVSHSIAYKQPEDILHRNKTVLIVGGGETASDLAVELCTVVRRIYMSIRGGQWFQERLVGDQPADVLFTKLLEFFGFYDNIFVKIGWTVLIKPFWGEGGTGIAEWKPRCRLFLGFLNKSRDVVDKVGLGTVIPKRGITDIKENMVTFDDGGKPVHIDHILFCTGYQWYHSFLDEKLKKEVKRYFDNHA
jgi:dimethylaniline monooxygenase (N-oxide forming)